MPDIDRIELENLACDYLIAAGAYEDAAGSVTRAMVRAEAEGNSACGLFYLRVFKEQLALNKVAGKAKPKVVNQSGSVLQVDAVNGFAHPAIELATEHLIPTAQIQGISAAGISRSYNALSLAHHVLPLAEAGLIGFCCSNAPASVAPPGGTRPVFGTNPMAFAVPGADGPALVIDQSASAVTKTAILMREQDQNEIPLGWTQDSAGQPTTDPATGLAGSLLPFGGQKGSNVGLMVEVLAAVLTGSNLSVNAPSFSGQDPGRPHVGQFILAIDPSHFPGPPLSSTFERLAQAHDVAGVRLPGQKFRNRKKITQTLNIDAELLGELRAVAPLPKGK